MAYQPHHRGIGLEIAVVALCIEHLRHETAVRHAYLIAKTVFPVLPVCPVEPVLPVDPVCPVDPVEPVNPIAPVGPVILVASNFVLSAADINPATLGVATACNVPPGKSP